VNHRSSPKDPRLTASYDYTLQESAIATAPVHPRDHARLLVYDRRNGRVTHTQFSELLHFIPETCDVLLNDTRVIKARIFGQKMSGGRVELLLNKPLDALRYLVFIKGRVKVGTTLMFDRGLVAMVTALNPDGSRVVTFSLDGEELRFEALVQLLDEIGHTPLPPYIKRQDSEEDERDYQTLFARKAGAVAAPTASLHFTPELFDALKQAHRTHTITLHVGAGTFKPVEAEEILDHPMHSEYFHIPDETAQVLEEPGEILAIGTTVTRTIEYFVRTGKRSGECDLFLHPLNPPRRVDHLLTNFHLPRSTLIMLVSAFIGREKTLELYQEALDNGYRFFSYGDAMLIL